MRLQFPNDFIFGTSTAAAQIETAFAHDWQGVIAKDGERFDRTTDHEIRWKEDADLIAHLAPWYRMGLMWSKLQRGPGKKLHKKSCAEYHRFLKRLRKRNVRIMMVLHHFTNPVWFANLGGWEKKENVDLWLDFCAKVVEEFGEYADIWNTFNEPNVYASYGWVTGFFPPFKKNPYLAATVVQNLGRAHNKAYRLLKKHFPQKPVGISHNAAILSAENPLGWVTAGLADWWFMDFIPSHFERVDFFGISYYARIGHDPLPITFVETPEKMKKLGRPHDDMWEYYPAGLRECLGRYWKKYKKPFIITENGVADSRDVLRSKAIADYASVVHQAMADGIDIRGYFWWSTWDNFEWHLGPSCKFGLYACDWETKDRTPRPSAELFRKLAHYKMIDIAD